MSNAGTDNSYELILITKSDTEELANRISKLIEDRSGTIAKKEAWGRKNFSYPVKKESSGFYFDWYISLEKKDITDFKKNLTFDEDVLRYLILSE